MNINFDNNIPVYIQLLDYLKTCIISGQFELGEKLPSVREFSGIFKVNPNTMQKALIELEEQKLIYTERTNGKFVTNDKKIVEKLKKEYAQNIVNKYFDDMKKIGIDKTDALNYLDRKEWFNAIRNKERIKKLW